MFSFFAIHIPIIEFRNGVRKMRRITPSLTTTTKEKVFLLLRCELVHEGNYCIQGCTYTWLLKLELDDPPPP